ncbi:MAG: hypothetical protein KGL39_20485 [Patescibacteria group bacterium]|nr:hypothetical protein [Patescibacteria group bacterium]
MIFQSDNRDNPGLHRLHVRWAYENLRIAKDAIDALNDRSQVSATIMAGALNDAMQVEIKRDAACFEAAALLFAGLEPEPDDDEEEAENDTGKA